MEIQLLSFFCVIPAIAVFADFIFILIVVNLLLVKQTQLPTYLPTYLATYIVCSVLASLVYLQQRNVKKSNKLMKFSGNMCLTIILKVTKKTGLYPFFRKQSFEKTTRGGLNCHLSRFRVNRSVEIIVFFHWNFFFSMLSYWKEKPI